jgi:hypothetical protein
MNSRDRGCHPARRPLTPYAAVAGLGLELPRGRVISWHDATPASLPPARTELIGWWARDADRVSNVYVVDPNHEVDATRGRGAFGSTQWMNAFGLS